MSEKLVALVTGAHRGIGAAIARKLGQDGYAVAVCARSQGPLEAFVAALQAEGVEAKGFVCDVSDAAQVDAMFKGIQETWGRLDVVVNNAGITRDGLVFRMSLEDWEAVIRTNLTSAFLVSRTVARHMIKKRSGSIINVSSVVGIMGNGGQTNYAASKAGVIGFTKSLAREVASRGVRVNALAPGFIETSMTDKIPAEAKEKLLGGIPLGRTGRPEDVAQAALFLAGDASSYITGEVIKIDGGMGM